MFLINKQRRIQANVTARIAAIACNRIAKQWICARMSQPIFGSTFSLVTLFKNDEKLICS